jgi:hypothetical protein
MLAFFDDKGSLSRFDVLGGASALFYIEENGAFATVNKPESKMLSATFLDGNIQKIYYYEEAKNDAYPIVQLSGDDQKLKGFDWQAEKRPADRNAVTPLSLRPSERRAYEARPHAKFTQTNIYFPGYMNDVYRQMEVRDSLQRVRARDRQLAQAREAERNRLDSLARVDSLLLADSLARVDSLALADSLAKVHVVDSLVTADSLKHVTDSLAIAADTTAVVLTPAEIKAAEKAAKKAAAAKARAERKAARAARKKAKQEALEAKWAELDRRDADKAAIKAAKKLAKERKRKRRALEGQAQQQRRDLETLERYRQKYEERKARKSRSN